MGLIIVCMVVVTLTALVYKKSEYDRGFATWMAFIVSGGFGAMVAFLILPMIGSEYQTEYAKPLVKMKDAGYVKLVPSEGNPAFIYKPQGGYVQVAETDEDETLVIHYYQTRKEPRVEKRCGYVEDWVFPWDAGTYADFYGCDLNIYVPAHKDVILK